LWAYYEENKKATMDDSPYLFISYSRIQFYFVEALAHALATLKVPYWFDVEQLEMGTDWQAGIDNGLANCQALVLVASRASIGSPNVRYEWETAQKANKPIFLALFEAVDLPPELRGLPIIDFRGNFRQGVRHLVELFQSQQTGQAPARMPHQEAPRPNRFNLPTRMPSGVLVVFLTLWVIAAGCLISAALLAPLSFSLAFIFLIGMVGYGYYWWRFATRQYVHSEVRSALALSTFLSIGALFFTLSAASNPNPLLRVAVPILTVLYAAILIGSLLSLLALGYSAAIFRWSPLGQGPRRLRERALHLKRRPGVKFTPLQKTYSLSYAPPDKRVAAQVRRAMAKGQYTEVAIEAGTADHNLVVLSNVTPVALLEAQSNQLKEPVSIVASSIRGATPDEKELRAVTRFQWVDYRNREPRALADMAEILWLSDSGQPVSEKDYHVVPESFRQPVASRSVSFVAGLLRFIVSFYGTVALFGVLGLVLPIPYLRINAAPSGAALISDVIQLGLCVFLLWLCVGIVQRSVNFSTSLLGLAAIVLMALVLPALTRAGTTAPVAAATSVGQTAADLSASSRLLGLGTDTTIGLILVLAYVLNLRGLYRWLPLSGEPLRVKAGAEPTLRQFFARSLWRTNAVFFVVFVAGVLALNQAGVNISSRTQAAPITRTIDHLQITLPQGAASMPISNGDLRSIVVPPSWLSPVFFDSADQFIHNQPPYGPLLWLGAYQPDPASTHVIVFYLWRFQPQSSDFLVPDHPELEIDRMVKNYSTVEVLNNFARDSRSNQDTLLDSVTYDETAGTSSLMHWRIAIRGKQYSYLLFMYGVKQDMTKYRATLDSIVSSLIVNEW
jgi:hypothetical protein